MNKKLIILFIFAWLPLRAAMIPFYAQQCMRSKNFLPQKSIYVIRKTADQIVERQLSYEDYDKRKGIIWSDLVIETQPTKIMGEWKKSIKLTLVDGKIQKHNPESIMHYPHLKDILQQQILPKTFALLTIQRWVPLPLPKKIFAQFFLQRCHSSDAIAWHQDPGEDYTQMADFSLVLPLSEKNDLIHGWHGGDFKIRPGLPNEQYNEKDVRTIIHEYNQAVLFNNKQHSHAVTAITSPTNQGKRDLIVVTLYVGGERPEPLNLY